MVYVDDFKAAGPKRLLPTMWKALRADIDMEEPAPFGLFLGCKHIVDEVVIPGCPVPVRRMTYDVQDYLQKTLDDYQTITGSKKISPKPTPFFLCDS